MKTCSLNHFLEAVKPWLNSDYIQTAHLDQSGHVVLNFTDGVKNVYRIDDCSRSQLEEILEDFQANGIRVIS